MAATSTVSPALGPAALFYAQKLGFPVFPLHSVKNGVCSCGKPSCDTNAGKHPRTPHGFKDASLEESEIDSWWQRWPDANIGIPTGKISGLIVLDIDPRNGGNDSLDALLEIHGPLPDTSWMFE